MPVATVPRLVAAAMLLCAASHADDKFTYAVNSVTVTDLGTLGGSSSSANDINDAGNIVGLALGPSGGHHAFFYSGGVMLDIGTAWAGSVSEARSLNNSNVVVGYLFGPSGFQAVLWSAGGWVELYDSSPNFPFPPFIPLPGESSAESISDSGRIAGWRRTPGSFQIATVWTDPAMYNDLEPNPLGVDTYATDINAASLVLGHGDGSGSHRWQFIPGIYASPRVGVPSLAGSTGSNQARGINRWGEIVGFDSWQATLWNGVADNATALGVLPTGSRSIADDINDAGFIAGFADRQVTTGGTAHTPYSAFLYHRDFGMYALPKLPTTAADGECAARALNNINANGRVQVVGDCSVGDQYSPRHAVR